MECLFHQVEGQLSLQLLTRGRSRKTKGRDQNEDTFEWLEIDNNAGNENETGLTDADEHQKILKQIQNEEPLPQRSNGILKPSAAGAAIKGIP